MPKRPGSRQSTLDGYFGKSDGGIGNFNISKTARILENVSLEAEADSQPQSLMQLENHQQAVVGPISTENVVNDDDGAERIITTDELNIYILKGDIGAAVAQKKRNITIEADQRYKYLTETWEIPENYNLPVQERVVAGKPKPQKLSTNILSKFKNFAYSELADGVFCKVCVLFQCAEQSKDQRLGIFTYHPFKTYAKMSEMFKKHENSDFHKANFEQSKLFAYNFLHPEESITTKITTGKEKIIERNRKVITPMVQSTLYLARNG